MKRLVTVAALVVLALGAGTARAAGLTCGTVITSPGVYTLTSNLNCSAIPPSTFALGIASDGVTIDLNGYSIIGPGGSVPTFSTPPTIGIESTGGVIRNGTIRGFDVGIYNDATAQTQAASVRLTKNGYGVFVESSGSMTISNSFVNENVGDGVVLSPNSAGAYISGTQITRNGGNGITDEESPLFATGNVISGNHGYGIWNFDWGAVIQNNQVNNNGADGIYIGPDLDFPDTWTITNNRAIGNGGHGIDFEGHAAVVFEYPPVTFEANVAHDNHTSPQCINIFCRTS